MKQTKIMILIIVVVVLVVGIFFINYSSNTIEPKKNTSSQNDVPDENNWNTQIPNPAGRYCHLLGYKIRINETKEGQQGICIFPDGTECDEWKFYAGLCSQNWSYCEQQGYISKIKNDSKDNYSGLGTVICITKDSGIEVGAAKDLMNLSLSRPANSTLPPG